MTVGYSDTFFIPVGVTVTADYTVFCKFAGERALHSDDPALLDGDPDRAGHPREAAALAAPEVQGGRRHRPRHPRVGGRRQQAARRQGITLFNDCFGVIKVHCTQI